MKRFNFSNKKIGMGALAASVLVLGLVAMPFQVPMRTELALKDVRQDTGRTTQKHGQMESL
jgi:hypothetical protein